MNVIFNPVMSRRSSRLVSGGYYHSDEESDSSTVTNISYRENPVKVFKKAKSRKSAPRKSSKANSKASSGSTEAPVTADVSLDDSSLQPAMRTVSYVATPRPSLSPSARCQTPTRRSSPQPEESTHSGPCSTSTPASVHTSKDSALSQSGMDSSGYSSSEGAHRKHISSNASRSIGMTEDPDGCRNRISAAFYNLTASVSAIASEIRSKVFHESASANVRDQTKKMCGLFLLLLFVLICIWLLFPLLSSFASFMSVLPETKPTSEPIVPTDVPPHPSITPAAPVLDPAVLSALVGEKVQHFMLQLEQEHQLSLDPAVLSALVEEKVQHFMLQLEQEHQLSLDPAVTSALVEEKVKHFMVQHQLKQEHQLSQKQQLDVESMKVKVEALDSAVSELGGQIKEYQTENCFATAGLSQKVQNLEAQIAKLSQKLSTIELMPPPPPCPDTNTAPVLNRLTPELKQALEKWLTDRIREKESLTFTHAVNHTECARPMADKMADFALETQGASIISTRCSETYRVRSACVTLFGFPLWYPSESPRTVIQGFPALLPGKCWAFHGVQGTLVISLSHPIRISHVTLDHLPRYNSPTGRIDSAPKDFEVYGMRNDSEEGTLLGEFTYDENGESTQTFAVPKQTDAVYRLVELRVLSNWGHVEYTCLYRFRVHGKIDSI